VVGVVAGELVGIVVGVATTVVVGMFGEVVVTKVDGAESSWAGATFV
jgi:hypothetical protein